MLHLNLEDSDVIISRHFRARLLRRCVDLGSGLSGRTALFP